MRALIPILGDQLGPDGPALRRAAPGRDVVCMAEVDDEVRRHPYLAQRVVLVFAAMRRHRDRLRERGFTVAYQEIGTEDAAASLPDFLVRQMSAHRPDRVELTEPGRHALREALCGTADAATVPIRVHEDDGFLCSHAEFGAWAAGRKRLTMEHFYRHMRRRHGVLMDGDAPAGGTWNYDRRNRAPFGADGPPDYAEPVAFRPDAATRTVIDEVRERFPGLVGSSEGFDWPVTKRQAERAVEDFIANRLPTFGTHQDAMWSDRPWLSHSRLAAALNLQLLDVRSVIRAAEEAYRSGHAPVHAVEGFVRQLLGWREFVRGVYWLHMPEYKDRNALGADADLPALYWTGETDMECLRQVVSQLLVHAYAHHIQRLMVTGLFAQLLGVAPLQVHDWYMAMYTDSAEWVTLPNTIGMSQYADGGIVGTKPYVASGQYIDRMSDYCRHCRFEPTRSVGDGACPFTTLYWDFLRRHRDRFARDPRMALQVRNWARKPTDEQDAIARQAVTTRRAIRDDEI